MDQVQAMRIFTRIVELGSFSRAAERLQLPRATVSNALKRLEQRLGVRLLIRTTRQVQVTSEGSLYYQRCVQLLGALEEADTLFSHHKLQPSGKVRIDMPHSLARQIVIPALDDFYRRYPDITLALGANDTHVDLLREGVDCVLRAWETEDDSLVARRIAQLPQVTCASPLICRPTARRSTSIAWSRIALWGIFPGQQPRLPAGILPRRQAGTARAARAAQRQRRRRLHRRCAGRHGIDSGGALFACPWLEQGELVEVLADTPPRRCRFTSCIHPAVSWRHGSGC